jgi:predicted DNA-binding transcriptional regulator AlpA
MAFFNQFKILKKMQEFLKSLGNQQVSITLTAEDLREFAERIANETLARANNLSADDSEPLLTRDQVSKLLGVNLATLWRWERDNYLMPKRFGRRCRYRQSDVNRVLSAEKGGKRNV